MHHYPDQLKKLIQHLRKLPGVGTKSAERYAFQLLEWKPEELRQLAGTIREVPEKITHCSECGALKETTCSFCLPSPHRKPQLCIVASPREIYNIHETGDYHGHYHVIGGTISPLEGRGPEIIQLPHLLQRIETLGIEEVIIALDSTLEGDATALYLKKQFESHQIPTTRLAFGLPMGSSLEYVDGGTLAQALSARTKF